MVLILTAAHILDFEDLLSSTEATHGWGLVVHGHAIISLVHHFLLILINFCV